MSTAAESNEPRTFQAPQMSPADLSSFHESHFSSKAVEDFGQGFMNSAAPLEASQDDDEWEEEDDLGYYEDGVKRTLTDEQIDIFRHSELRELRRQQERNLKQKGDTAVDESLNDDKESPTRTPGSSLPSNFHNKKKKKSAKNQRHEPKPDLRKRTWDVVEAGLDSLDYD